MKNLIPVILAATSILATHAAEPPAAADAARWSAEKANQWYASQPWPCGFNYVPAHAISYTEMWMPYNFDVAKMDKELAMAKNVGFNCLRVVLPFVVWEHDPDAFPPRKTGPGTLAARPLPRRPHIVRSGGDCVVQKDHHRQNARQGVIAVRIILVLQPFHDIHHSYESHS